MKRESRSPLIIAIVALALTVLYVGSYLALVVPQGRRVVIETSPNVGWVVNIHYRMNSDFLPQFYWPVEQIDRKLRPGRGPWTLVHAVSLNSAFPARST